MHRSWIKQYEQEMFYKGDEGVVAAVDIKYKNMSPLLYKYRPDNENSINAFKNDILFFSAPSMFNDPYESLIKKPNNKELVKKHLIEKHGLDISGLGLEKFFDDTFDLAKEIALKGKEEPQINLLEISEEIYRVCSFSETNDSVLMWSHYANMHKGFCLGYDFRSRHSHILTELLLPVIYDDSLLDITKPLLEDNTQGITMHALTRKATAWSYEREWRCIVSNNIENIPNGEKSIPIKTFPPSVVYFGSKASENLKEKLISIAKDKGMPVYQTNLSSEEFKIESQLIG
jgi:hypothetical protein